MIGNQKKRRAPWSKVSKTVWRSTDTIPICICLFIPVKVKSNNRAKQKPVEWFVLKPDWYIPANIRLDEDVLKTSFVFVFRRRLDQDEYVRLSLTSSGDVFKTSWSRPVYSSCLYVFKMSCKNVFKTSWRCLAKISSRRFQDVLSS